MNENIFDKLDFGPLRPLLDNDDITDISYCNNGQIWIRSLTQGSMRVEVEGATPEFVEKLAFQCSNVMGTTFNNAKPFLDAESSELRLNFVHQSIATNGIALVIRKTPAKIRLEKDKLLNEEYFTNDIHDFLIKCVQGHCNIMVAGETGSGKTEFVKYLASHTKTNEKIITIEDTLELHLDRIFPQRDIVAMKTNNVASYSDVLVTCMRQNPKWILLSEVRSAEAVSAVRNSISSGHNILSTIHADKASAIPYRLYSLMETDLDVHQFLTTIYRYVQLGVHIKAYYSKKHGKFHREVDEVTEFYVDDNNTPQSRVIYQKLFGKTPMMRKPSPRLIEYLENQNIDVQDIIDKLPEEMPFKESEEEETTDEAVHSTETEQTETSLFEQNQNDVQPVQEPVQEETPTEDVPVEQPVEVENTVQEEQPQENQINIATVEEQVVNAEDSEEENDMDDDLPEEDGEEETPIQEEPVQETEQRSELEIAMSQEHPITITEENNQVSLPEQNTVEINNQIEIPQVQPVEVEIPQETQEIPVVEQPVTQVIIPTVAVPQVQGAPVVQQEQPQQVNPQPSLIPQITRLDQE